MCNHRLSHHLSQAHGDCVADETPEDAKSDRFIGAHELVLRREGLQDRGLAKGNGPILVGGAEPSISLPEALRCDGWARFIPGHAPVYARIGRTTALLVTRGLEAVRPVAPRSALLRVTYPLKVCLA